MRLAIVLAAVLLAACNPAPCECQCHPAQAERLGLQMKSMRGLTAASATPEEASRVIRCKPGKPCEVEVRVREVNGSCQAELPYCVVCAVRAAGKAGEINVVWEIKLADAKQANDYDYYFHPSQGIDLFYGGMTGKEDFKNQGHAGPPQRFRWVTGADKSDRLAHAAVVMRKSKKDGTETQCVQIDPDLVNTN